MYSWCDRRKKGGKLDDGNAASMQTETNTRKTPVAQQSFLLLRALALRQSPGRNTPITFIAVSHSSAAATQKWIDMLGGTRGVVKVIVDEERAIYAAWGLGTGSAWYVLNW